MIIKKYVGKSEKDTLELAQKELGIGVVVMNVKNVKRKGLMRLFKPQLVEMTVALEEEQDKSQAIKQELTRDVTPQEARRSLQEAIKEEAERKEEAARREEAFRRKELEKRSEKPTEEQDLTAKLDNLQNLIETQIKADSKKGEQKEVEKTRPEKEEKDSELVRFLRLLYNTMIENEVNEKYANEIIDDLDKYAKPDMPIETLLANVYQKTILKFGEPTGITPAQNGPKLVFFVGPTGVGKTTTIAKIASKFRVEEHKKVALLTADTYRIAAAEQLHTYADILEVPFQVIYTEDEIHSAIEEYKSYDYILVDTAGHSHHNEAQKEKMNGFIHCIDESIEKEVYLVVSATTKYSDLVSIADSYQTMTKFKIIFTKLDETTTLGSILNLKLHTGAELSYITCGQNVPDDIEPFNPQRTVKLLLGGRK